jgi:GDP-mannose 6-dehydrogenase
MKLVIVGLGYVGAVTGSVLADLGHDVTIVEKNGAKVEKFNKGLSPISEPGLEELIRKGMQRKNLLASQDLSGALQDCDMVIVNVGTPTNKQTGQVDLSALENVIETIGDSLLLTTKSLLLAISSTVPPGTTENVVRMKMAKKGVDESLFKLAFIPEFLREATAISDFIYPTRFIIGSRNVLEGEAFKVLRPELSEISYVVKTETAEMLKTVENSWHATKVTFANEIGRISNSINIDANEVMELLIKDTKQNVSSLYMRPGFAFGGSCLPKDLRSLNQIAQRMGVSVPMLDGVFRSNMNHIETAVEEIQATGRKNIAVLGLAFKAGTDDLRESPIVALVERLVGKGYKVGVHDFDVRKENLYGANLKTWNEFEHLAEILTHDLAELTMRSDVVVLAQHNRNYLSVLKNLSGEKKIIDLTGLYRGVST